MEAEKVLLSAERSPICCDAQQRGQMMGSRHWSHVCFSARGYLFWFWPCSTTRDLGFAFKPCHVILQSIILFICGKQNITFVMLPRLVSQYSLTFRLLSSPGGLSGAIILRYSSFVSLCSDFPSRSVAWSLQAASCAYSCLWMIERAQKSRAHQKGRVSHILRGRPWAITAWVQMWPQLLRK